MIETSPQIPRLLQGSTEWYTPSSLLDTTRRVLGTIELDPASCSLANQTVQATRYYDQQVNGLRQAWIAETVWLHPPYCKSGNRSNQEVWTRKLLDEYQAGNVKQALLLVNAATETRWFHQLYAFPICFLKGRIHFTNPTGITTGPTVGSAIVYLGDQVERFINVFGPLGVVVHSVSAAQRDVELWKEMEA